MGQIEDIIGLIKGEQIEGGNTKERVSEVLTLIAEEIAKKIDKEEGKGLSSNDYTNTDKENLDKALNSVVRGFSMHNTDNGDIQIIVNSLKNTTLGSATIYLSQVYATKEYIEQKTRELEQRLRH